MKQRIIRIILVAAGLLIQSNAFATEKANRLELPQKIEVEKGTTELLLPILLTNADAITGFQCDLHLPEGFTVATDEYDDHMIDVARTTTKRHSIATREMSDGALRILLTSMTNATFSGNSGTTLNVTVNVASNVAVGSYNVDLKNIVLTDPEATRYISDDVTGVLVIKPTVRLGDVNGDGKITITDAVAIVNYILGTPSSNFNEATADVNGDGKISITDAVVVVNIILQGAD